ncbi:glycosyltransferase, partial [Salmonella enterica]|nr:glycosyltransferase [Salmonella enterica]
MNILLVITGLGLGGAEKQVCLLADQFAARGHKVGIVSLTNKTDVKPSNPEVELFILDMKKNVLGFIGTIKRLRVIANNFNPDVIHGHMFHANIMVRFLNALTTRKNKIISTAHNKYEGGALRKCLYRLTDPFNHITTNVSQEALDKFIADKVFLKKKSFTVYNGIDTNYFKFNNNARSYLRQSLNVSEQDILLLAVGRLTEAKDYPNLIKAFKKTPSNYKLIIIGEGDAEAAILKIIENNNLSLRIKLLGVKNNVRDYYSASDIFVLSSAWEGFGLVVAEAMSCERIVIATDSGGVKEVIGNPEFLVPIKNPDALAKKIIDISKLNSSYKEIICKKNRSFIVDNFSIDNTISK